MVKSTTIDAFFKKINPRTSNATSSSPPSIDTPIHDRPKKVPRIEIVEEEDTTNILQRDPGLRRQIYDYPVNQRDEIRRVYLKLGPYHLVLKKNEYPLSGDEKHPRRFQAHWFKLFPWLEYSRATDAVFCFPCYIFNTKATESTNTFTIKGFRNWKKVRDGEDCSFLTHVGKDPNSSHNQASRACEDLMKKSQHIEMVIQKQTSEQIAKNRLRLKTSIDSVRWLTLQACALRGHDERLDSRNRGNFLEMIKMLASYNDKVAEVVLENAPGNASYISPKIQKEILHILSCKVRNAIVEEIGDSKFCIIVDEARDESKREQMALVLRFVDKDGILRERFFDIAHVPDTSALTLKVNICALLSHYNLNISNIRGQGYDGASNMHGEWNGLKALILHECPYAYYIHCLAHRLQLALVAAVKCVLPIYHFFTKLTSVVNIVGASCKRNDELHVAQAKLIEESLSIGEIESGKGLNQIGTLQRAGDTRWSSHFASVCGLIKMYEATCIVLKKIVEDGCTYTQRGDADSAYSGIAQFDFVFILHLMQEIMGITDVLCQALQSQSQDIINALQLVKTTKVLLQKLRDDGWSPLLEKVKLFCIRYEIIIPDMSGPYFSGISRRGQKEMTNEHYYRVEVFITAIDTQQEEINDRFNEQTMELFVLSAALDPKDGYKLFKVDDICSLVDKFYPEDFTAQEKIHLKYQLQHYGLDIPVHSELKNLSTLTELSEGLVKTEKSTSFNLVYRVICLVLTLPVSTATTERAFSAMKLVKSRLRNKMEDDFLADSMTVYIEREIAATFSTESLIDAFNGVKSRRVQF